jgi:hypothetical protein
MKDIPNTHQMIREAKSELGNAVTNKQVKEYCFSKYGVKPLSQTIYSAIGSEWSRSAERISAQELLDSKRFVRHSFNGDKDKALLAIDLAGNLI